MKKVYKSLIKCQLEAAEDATLSIKSLRSAVLSHDEVSSLTSDKSDMKKHFASAFDSLLEKSKIKLRGDNVTLQSTSADTDSNEKNPKKRKHSNADDYSDPKHTDTVVEDNDGKDEMDVHRHAKDVLLQYAYSNGDKIENKVGDVTILLFYAYCVPPMTRGEQDAAIAHCYSVLQKNGCTGRLRVSREGFNCTLTGPSKGIRAFTTELKKYAPHTFQNTDFKYVDNQPSNQLLKGLKVWPVTEIVTYGFDPKDAPLDMVGTHLNPRDFHSALASPNSIVIDVRNFNETLIGKFAPNDNPEKVLDPLMRRSTEFPQWVDDNKHKFVGKQVLMYCTAGVRCERASAFMRNKGVQNVFQLEGGIHRYLEEFSEDGGFWKGKNYVFDKRFSHGADKSEVISFCVHCKCPWDRYQAQRKCYRCEMEVLLCKTCQRSKPAISNDKLICPLCNNM